MAELQPDGGDGGGGGGGSASEQPSQATGGQKQTQVDGTNASSDASSPPPAADGEDSRTDARIFDTKHVFFDPVTMEPDGWPKTAAKNEATLTGLSLIHI